MNANIERLAETLASRNYAIELLTDGSQEDGQIYLALNPELKGCMAQGATIDEAIKNLSDARIDFIASLIVDGLEVPEPFDNLPNYAAQDGQKTDSNNQVIFKTYHHGKPEKTKENRAVIYQISSC